MSGPASRHTTIRDDAPAALRAMLATDPTLLASIELDEDLYEGVTGFSLAPDGAEAFLFITGGEGQYTETTAQHLDIATGDASWGSGIEVPLSARSAAYSPDGRWMALPQAQGGLLLWDRTLDDDPDELLLGHECQALTFHPDGRRLVVATEDVSLIVWDLAQARAERVIPVRRSQILDVAFDPAGTLLFGATQEGLCVWSVDDGELHFEDREPAMIYTLALTRDGSRVASGTGDGRVVVWELPALRRAATLQGHTNEVPAVAFSPDGTLLASGGYDGRIKIRSVESGREVASIEVGRVLLAIDLDEDDDEEHADDDGEIISPTVRALVWDEHGLLAVTGDGGILRWT